MRFRIPPDMKETVTIVQQSAFERNTLETVATVDCMILPHNDVIRVVDGVASGGTGWQALLQKPNTAITEDNILQRADNTEFIVHRVRHLGGTMILELKSNQ